MFTIWTFNVVGPTLHGDLGNEDYWDAWYDMVWDVMENKRHHYRNL